MTTREDNTEVQPRHNGSRESMELVARVATVLVSQGTSAQQPPTVCSGTNGAQSQNMASEHCCSKTKGLNCTSRMVQNVCKCGENSNPESDQNSFQQNSDQANGHLNGTLSPGHILNSDVNGIEDNPILDVAEAVSRNASIINDISSASFFSLPDDRLTSPGSDSMVTASDGRSSRSCSSLSCPSSSSSAATSVCAQSPERELVLETDRECQILLSESDALLVDDSNQTLENVLLGSNQALANVLLEPNLEFEALIDQQNLLQNLNDLDGSETLIEGIHNLSIDTVVAAASTKSMYFSSPGAAVSSDVQLQSMAAGEALTVCKNDVAEECNCSNR